MTYCNIDDDILRADDVDLNLFRARRVNGRARMAITSPPSFATVSQIGQDIFHSRLFNLIYICSLDHSHTHIHTGNTFRPIPSSLLPAKRSFSFSRFRESSGFRSSSSAAFQESKAISWSPNSASRDIPSTTSRRNYEQRKYRPLRFFSSFLSHLFIFPFLPFFFFVDFIRSAEYHCDERAHRGVLSDMRRAISRVCHETHGVENSRKFSCHRECERYSFTKLIISLRVEREDGEEKERSWVLAKLN